MIHFVLCGHGSFGSGLLESMSMLLPEVADISFIDFTKEMDSTDLTTAVKNQVFELGERPTLFICDLLGGAPFKTCCIESIGRDNIMVLAGINLTGLLEIYFHREDDLETVAKLAIKTSQEAMDYYPHNSN